MQHAGVTDNVWQNRGMDVIDPITGIHSQALQCESPNCDARPAGCLPDLIVVHGISLPPGEFGGPYIDQLFTNSLDPDAHPYFAEIKGLEVSAHFLIRRDGQLVQYVPISQRAWHAGQSCHAGRDRCNDFSVGIELEGDDEVLYEDEQYASLALLIKALRSTLPTLADADIVGHDEIAPGRKTDPGPAFHWSRLYALLGN